MLPGLDVEARIESIRARLALQNAASVAGLLLTTEVMIAEAPKDESDHVHPSAGGGLSARVGERPAIAPDCDGGGGRVPLERRLSRRHRLGRVR